MRTTGLQVSGYRFLLRRLELALTIGDPRMAHDPLKNQRRAMIVGILISALIAGGAVMLSLLRPAPAIDGENLVADEHGSLYVRLTDGLHPVSNVASARLALQEPASVKTSTAKLIADQPVKDAIGIGHVPSLNPAPNNHWFVCDMSQHNEWSDEPSATPVDQPLQVKTAAKSNPLEHAVVRSPEGVWLLAGTKRSLAAGTASRALGAPEVPMSSELLRKFDEQADSLLPSGPSELPQPFHIAGTVIHSGDRSFLVGHRGVAELHGPRRDYAVALSPVPPVAAELAEVMRLPTVDLLSNVPADPVTWADTEQPCLGNDGLAEPGSAESADGTYAGPNATSALLTEHGFVLVDATGTRFSLGKAEDLQALGFEDHRFVPWRIIDSLADGGELSEEKARATRPTINTVASTAASNSGTK